MDNRTRITIRIEPEEWSVFDDLRHQRRTTFQELFVSYLRSLVEQNNGESVNNLPSLPSKGDGILTARTTEEREACGALLQMMRSHDEAWDIVNFALEKHKGRKNRAKSKAQAGEARTGTESSNG